MNALLGAERTDMETNDKTAAALEKAREALEFYANGDHFAVLLGPDWQANKQRLESRGYSFVGNVRGRYDDYVENGRTAQDALDSITELLVPNGPSNRRAACGTSG